MVMVTQLDFSGIIGYSPARKYQKKAGRPFSGLPV